MPPKKIKLNSIIKKKLSKKKPSRKKASKKKASKKKQFKKKEYKKKQRGGRPQDNKKNQRDRELIKQIKDRTFFKSNNKLEIERMVRLPLIEGKGGGGKKEDDILIKYIIEPEPEDSNHSGYYKMTWETVPPGQMETIQFKERLKDMGNPHLHLKTNNFYIIDPPNIKLTFELEYQETGTDVFDLDHIYLESLEVKANTKQIQPKDTYLVNIYQGKVLMKLFNTFVDILDINSNLENAAYLENCSLNIILINRLLKKDKDSIAYYQPFGYKYTYTRDGTEYNQLELSDIQKTYMELFDKDPEIQAYLEQIKDKPENKDKIRLTTENCERLKELLLNIIRKYNNNPDGIKRIFDEINMKYSSLFVNREKLSNRKTKQKKSTIV